MTLYLKYRPQTIDELDLEGVRETLTNIIKSGNIPHSFLFSGPKGTGKTSAARILAKIINCTNLGKKGLANASWEPCNKCSSCLSIMNGSNIDVIELDAASNRGIDDIRSLKEGIYLSPAAAKKKVYIIDEVHMLTVEAANAFLKTLEEPPDHVIFILATTNPEKLPETVISRLVRVDFTKANAKEVARQLNRVAKGENIKITSEAIEKISSLADGSFRDAVKILESLSLKTKDIAIKDIKEENFGNFFEVLKTHDLPAQEGAKKALEFIENLIKNGISIKNFSGKILSDIHTSLLAKNGIGEDNLPNFSLEELINLNELITNAKKENSPIIQLPLEIAIIKFFPKQPVVTVKTEVKVADATPKKEEVKPTHTEIKKIEVKGSLDDSSWIKLLQNIRGRNVSIEALLRAAKPLGFDGKNLNVGVYYQFHKDRLEDGKNKKILEDICKESLNLDHIKISFELIEKPVLDLPKQQDASEVKPLTGNVDKDIIDAAKEIFG